MSTSAKVSANRSNSRKSRGPRSAGGKSRASVNALRHGLAAITQRDAALTPQIECIASALCGDDRNPLLREQALIIAERTVTLERVRAAQIAAIEQRLKDKDEAEAMRDATPQLDRLARFERKAWLHRKRAICRFMEVKSACNF